MERDMTVGSPTKMILNFTFPIFLGNVFQQFYNMGAKALAAVGSTGTIMFLIIGFLTGLTAGFTVPTSQKFGAGDMKAMRKTVGSAVILSAVVSIVMTIVSMLGMRGLLKLMHTPDDIFREAYSYIMVICAGIFAQVLYNLLASILRALGNSKTPLYFLILAAGLNVVLDLVFIIGFHMGAAGAAYATVVAQGVSGLLCLLYIIKKVPILHLTKDDWSLDSTLVKIQLGVGFPMALQYSITAIGSMMMQAALNLLGSLAIAGFTAGSKIEQLVTQAYVALGTTMATYCAQNTGAGKVDRIRKGFRSSTSIGIVYSVAAGVVIMFVGKYLTPLFLSENITEIMNYVDIYLKCVGAFFIPLTIVNVYRNGIQGMGYGILPMMAGVAELIGRGVVAIIAARYHSYFGVCMASPAAWILAGGLLLVMYAHVIRQSEKRFANYK